MAFAKNTKNIAQNPASTGKYESLDSGQMSKLSDLGFEVKPIASSPSVLSNTVPSTKQVMPGVGVPGYTDSFGNFYVVDEQNIVGQVVPKFNPQNSGPVTPVGGGGFGGGGVGGPVLPPPNNGGGGFGGGGGFPPQDPGIPTPTPPPLNFGSGRIFTEFQVGDMIPNQQETVTRALWSNNVGNLTTFYTSSTQTATQKRYYYEIFNSASSACGAAAQFAVAYGHKQGSGSADEGGQVNDTPTRAIYGQYRLLCLNAGEERFTIGGTATDSIYVVNVNRARMREYLDEGNLEINLARLSGSQFMAGGNPVNAHTGSNVKVDGSGRLIRLIDDSIINSATITEAGEVHDMVSGSIEDGVYNSSAPHIYGKLYKRLGVVVLDGNTLDMSCSFLTVTGSEIAGDNAFKLHTAISGAALYTDASGDTLGFAGRSAERVKSTHYFCRVKNAEYNFSNNPSFVTGSEGDLAEPTFIGNPRVYVTTVGLYNNRKECIAVAKLSQPLQKTFTRELLLKVKLDF